MSRELAPAPPPLGSYCLAAIAIFAPPACVGRGVRALRAPLVCRAPCTRGRMLYTSLCCLCFPLRACTAATCTAATATRLHSPSFCLFHAPVIAWTFPPGCGGLAPSPAHHVALDHKASLQGCNPFLLGTTCIVATTTARFAAVAIFPLARATALVALTHLPYSSPFPLLLPRTGIRCPLPAPIATRAPATPHHPLPNWSQRRQDAEQRRRRTL